MVPVVNLSPPPAVLQDMTSVSRTLIKRVVAPVALASSVCLLTAACSSSPSSPYGAPSPNTSSPSATQSHSASASQAASSATLTISGFAFGVVTVKAGQKVTVVNEDTAEHTVNVQGTGIDVTVPGGSDGTFKAPAAAGKYALTCDFHSDMHGTLTVTK
jgi:plastocyanin